MVKVISVSNHAYAVLLSRKKKDMSFSDVILAQMAEGEKKQSREAFLAWVEHQKPGKKTRLSEQVDSILYGTRS
ncbi:MAG: hypothetical protein HY917_02110 [Candidatus Diapherotrites archaeon]|nr:hypothetical protein [Candidatus Diapherotrites archaeon]